MAPIKTFFLEPTGRQRVWLRRFRTTREEDLKPCPLPYKYHNAQTLVGESAEKKDAKGMIESIPVEFYADDPRWPAQCPCGYVFSITDDADMFQVFKRTIYRRTDTGEEMIEDDAPVGAIYNAWWMTDIPGHAGPDGMFLICRMPGGHHWSIDGYASNCDSRCANANCGQPKHACKCQYPNSYKDSHPHKCWVRTGPPDKLTVGKGGPGESCNAGAGSIVVPGWHGFLRDGMLVEC